MSEQGGGGGEGGCEGGEAAATPGYTFTGATSGQVRSGQVRVFNLHIQSKLL